MILKSHFSWRELILRASNHVQHCNICSLKNLFITCLVVPDHVFPVFDPGCSVDCEHADCYDGQYLPYGRGNQEGMDTTGSLQLIEDLKALRLGYTIITAKKNMFWSSKNVFFFHSGRELCWPQSACSHQQRGLPRRKSIHRGWVLMGRGRWSWDCGITRIGNRCEACFMFIKNCFIKLKGQGKPNKKKKNQKRILSFYGLGKVSQFGSS